MMAATTRGLSTTSTTNTTTANNTGTGSPLRRGHLVWSHHTTYPSAAGVHSEVSRQSQALQVSSQRRLSTNLSTASSLHQKELRSLSQHRKSLEMSMLAYTQRMRKISADRLLIAGLPHQPSSGWTAPSVSPEDLTTTGSAIERLLAFNKSDPSSSGFSQTTTSRDARDSADSGIEDLEGEAEKKGRRPSDDELFQVVKKLPKDSSQEVKRRPASFHTIHSIASTDSNAETEDGAEVGRNTSKDSNSTTRKSPQRQRRPGTAEKPDPSKLNRPANSGASSTEPMERGRRRRRNTEPTRESSAPKDDDVPNAVLAITPFPECQASASLKRLGSKGGRQLPVSPDDEESYYEVHSSRKNLPKTRENYWSFRKAHHRRSLLLASSMKKPARALPFTPPGGTQAYPKAESPSPPEKKTFYHTFRYSDAVDDVLRSIEDRYSDRITHTAIRRVTEMLPTLDIVELRLHRKKMQEDGPRGLKTVSRERRRLSQDTHQSLESLGDEEGANPVGLITRERSMSAPQFPVYNHDDSASEEDTDTEVEVKLLVKRSEDSNIGGIAARKTVQFDLPPCDEQTEMRNE